MISFGMDAWTSLNSKAYIAVTTHFNRDDIPFSMLLDLVEVAQSHSGLNLATAFTKVLDDFGISDKVSLNFCFISFRDSLFCLLSITCDNAAPNDTMVDELSNLLDDFPGAPNRTWCFMHILNLVAKSISKQFDLPKAKADEVLDDAAQALADLAGDIEVEEELMGDDLVGDDEDDDSSDLLIFKVRCQQKRL